MTFEYRDQYSGYINAGVFLNRALVIKTNPHGCFIDPARVEEVVAGIRDAARTAARQTTGQDDTCDACGSPFPVGHLCLNPEPTASAVGRPAEAHDTKPPLTADERKLLHFALDLAFDALISGDGFTNEHDASFAKLRRMAGKDER